MKKKFRLAKKLKLLSTFKKKTKRERKKIINKILLSNLKKVTSERENLVSIQTDSQFAVYATS